MVGDCVEGVELDDLEIDIWHVPFQFYRLTKVEMWKNNHSTSGFKVTYSLPEDEYFDGWPSELTHMFGEDDLTDRHDSVELPVDLEKIDICVENINQNNEN